MHFQECFGRGENMSFEDEDWGDNDYDDDSGESDWESDSDE